jgi:hypothetical protein
MTSPTPRFEIRGWRKLFSRALDLLYPPLCVVCRTALADGRALCDGCDADLPRLAMPFCEKCGESFEGQIEGPFDCPNCSRLKFSFEFARPATLRDDRTLEMIHRLKYNRELHLAKDLGRLATESFADPRLAPALAENWPTHGITRHQGAATDSLDRASDRAHPRPALGKPARRLRRHPCRTPPDRESSRWRGAGGRRPHHRLDRGRMRENPASRRIPPSFRGHRDARLISNRRSAKWQTTAVSPSASSGKIPERSDSPTPHGRSE